MSVAQTCFSRYMIKRQVLRPSSCGEPMFASKELRMLLDDFMSNFVLLKSIVIILISSCCRNDYRISINFVMLMAVKAEDISKPVIMMSS